VEFRQAVAETDPFGVSVSENLTVSSVSRCRVGPGISPRLTRCCGDTYDCPGSKGIRRIYNHFVGFGDAAENLGLNSKVAPDSDIPELHYAFRVHYGYLEALVAEYECVIWQSN